MTRTRWAATVDGVTTVIEPADVLSAVGGAPLASPAFTGTPTAPTASAGTSTTQLATTAFVAAAITALLNGAPGALDTLKELADAINDDASFAATVTTALNARLTAANNLSDVASATTARLNLGVGGYDRFARTPSGYYSATPGLTSVSNTAFSGASTGSLQFCPMLLTPGKTYDQLAVYCGTAQVGGTVTVSLGIYADDGNGKPLLSGGALSGSTSTLTLTGTGVRSTGALTFVAPAVLVWGALLYVQTVAPSPYGATRTANNILRPAFTEPGGTGSFGYLMTGQSSLPTSGTLADYATPTVIAARAV